MNAETWRLLDNDRQCRSRLRAAILILLAVYAATSLAAGVFLAETALRPPRETASPAKARAIADQHHRRLEEVAIDTADGATLQACSLRPALPPATIIVTHGVHGSRGHALALASLLLKHGYAVLAPDARGHGTSGGLASYGVRERRDLASWVDLISARYPGRCVVGVGASMGAAQLLQAAGADRRICGVVAEASFATFKEVAFDRIAQHTGLGPVNVTPSGPAVGRSGPALCADALRAGSARRNAGRFPRRHPGARPDHSWNGGHEHPASTRAAAGGGKPRSPLLDRGGGRSHRRVESGACRVRGTRSEPGS